MPSRVPWWPQQPSFLGYAGPDDRTRRPCGCHIDPIVFGHHAHALLFVRACWLVARQDGAT